jgi:transposase
MEALSLDLRERVLAACDGGDLTRQEVAEEFAVSRSFVQKLLRRRADGRPLAPKRRSGGAGPVLGGRDLDRLHELVREKPDRTLAELRSALHESGGPAGGPAVSAATVCRALKKLGLPLKKRRFTPASGTRRGSGAYAGGGRRRRSRSPRRSWFSWTRAVPARR